MMQRKNHLKADETFQVTVKTVLSLASKAYDIFESSNIEQKRKLINYVFSNFQLRGVSLEYDLKKPFDLMVDCTTYSEWLVLINPTANWQRCKQKPLPALS